MIGPLIGPVVGPLFALMRGQCARLTRAVRERGGDAGISTLELAVIGLGLLLLATALIAAIKAAVDSRINQIK